MKRVREEVLRERVEKIKEGPRKEDGKDKEEVPGRRSRRWRS